MLKKIAIVPPALRLMKFSPHYLKRYKDLAWLVAKYGQPGMASKFGLEETQDRMRNRGQVHAHDLPADLERLGPTFVKLGQLLSSRADLLPDAYLRELSRLQDRVHPFPFTEVTETVESELDASLSKRFRRFDPEPLAAASLGQVHRATLPDGREVAVKVQRPHIRRQIEEDFAALEQIAGFLDRNTEFGRRYQLPRILEEFETTVSRELDYRREAANMLVLAGNLERFPHLRVPRPLNECTTRKVLTMDYVAGAKITELDSLARRALNDGLLADELLRAYLKQVLVDGTFHADPHPGNIFLTPDQRIALLDLGMVGHTAPAMQEDLLKLLLAVTEGDGDLAADLSVRMSRTGNEFDEARFRHKIGQLVAEECHSTLHEMDLGNALMQVGRCAAQTGLYVPSELTLVGKTLLQLQQIGLILAPDFAPNECIRRNAARLLNQRLKSSLTEGKLFSSLLELKQFVGGLPTRLNKIFDAVGNAELNVKVRPTDTQALLDSFQKLANRLTMGLVLAALIVGAALLMRVPTSFRLFGYPGLAILLFLAAAGGGLALVVNILWKDRQSRRNRRR